MTYKIDPFVEKIKAPVLLLLPDGSSRRYISGESVAQDTFEKKYRIMKITAVGGEIQIKLEEAVTLTNRWVGEQQSFF